MADPNADTDADQTEATTEPGDDADQDTDGQTEAKPGEGEAAETEATKAEDGKADTSSVGGTVPSWWEWVRRHPRPVIAVAGAIVVALVATLVLVSTLAADPEDVVQDYLDAIRAGDTDTALAIAGEPKATGRLEFLSAKALAGDWTVDGVVERHREDDVADVDVTLRAGDTTQQGRFHLVNGDDGWTIESPFVQVDLSAGNLGAVELGGVRKKVTRNVNEPGRPVRLLVFPGVYKLYPSLAKRVTFDPPVLIATPQENAEATLRVSADYTLTDDGADAAQRAVNAHIDDCATKTEVSPAGCPFNAEDNHVVRNLDDIDAVAWTVVAYPEVLVTTGNNGGLSLVVRKPGTVRLTGTGVPEEPEGSPRVNVATTCEFGINATVFDMTMDGFTASGDPGDDYSAARGTVCF